MWQFGDRGRLGFPLAVAGAIGATAVLAYVFRHGWLGIDLDQFALAGKTMLSANWRQTYANPFFQAGPLELAFAACCTWVAGTSGGLLAVVADVSVAAALVAVAWSFLGRRGLLVLAIALAAFATGGTRDPYVDGHFADSLNALLWLLAARQARRDRVYSAGLLVGLSAGLEVWGILGVSVLALAPTLRRAGVGLAVAAALAAAWYVPFALGGDFHMLAYRWHVTGGLPALLLGAGHPFGWSLRLVQGAVTVGVAAALARATRAAPFSVFAIPFVTGIVRLALDPMSINYYWDGTTELALLGAAALFVARGDVRAWLGLDSRTAFRRRRVRVLTDG